MKKTKEEVLKLIDKHKIESIRLVFPDILGQLKGMSITRSEIEKVLEEGQGFDGSSIEGFVRIEESDMVAMPDLDTFKVFPWTLGEKQAGIVFCDILNPDGTNFEGDPRYILRRTLDRIKKKGWTYYTGPELEYFYFKTNGHPEILDEGGYFDYSTINVGVRLRKKTISALEDLGIPVECSHHEVATSQHEIDLLYQDALTMADSTMLYRLIVKEVAQEEGYYATFMPKPIFGINGSGMHTHQSLFAGNKNLFFDPKDRLHLSKAGKEFIAGLLTHVKEFTLVTNQWVNSFKRLVPGYEAPVYISWAMRNRSSLIRVPMYKPGREKATRAELRSPDPACNPYLAFSVMLASGLKGVDKNYELPEPIEEDIYHMSLAERKKRKIDTLPESLEKAIEIFEKSSLMKETLGDHIFERLIANKRKEWDEFRIHVSKYETDKYLPLL
ncbi:MAG: glutamine synthetase [candidate division Zixibacteria bacterium RBG_16_50_21]|nr:MAG: glutamine synthetase [candidate division Zixibacteria bacterium RBG_16_50_21]